ncbi:hypothetical protein VTK26DRAFT_2749 [Humicola hyalothermophila]
MGIASLEPRFRPALPDTPPEVLTPDSASFPSRQSEERSWNPRAPPSPPMSNYDPVGRGSDMSSRKGSEETSSRSEASTEQGAPRQQLPPLSSLFGPPSPRNPFYPTTYGERSGSYTSSSPLDRPLGLGSSSYFPPSTTSSASQPRSVLDPKFLDRPQIPPLSRLFPGPLSSQPPLDSRQDERSGYGPGGRWPTQHEGSREQQHYQTATDRYAPPPSHPTSMGRDEIRRSKFRDQPSPQAPAHNSPSTPTSNVASEVPPAKDGLGPKIWTGTHFLPRFVRAAEVPGEGMCYFYDDGSHCKTVIDGEAVNAHWGVTKAGKPRKRLAIACVTCREKKIKCDPDYPRCLQCEKFGRVCKFKNAPRGGHNTSPSTPSAEPDDLRRLGNVPRTRTASDQARPGSHSSESVSPRTTLRPASPDQSSSGPRKQARVGYEHYSPTAGTRSPLLPTPAAEAPRSAYSWRPSEPLPRIHEDVLCRPWQQQQQQQPDAYPSDRQFVNGNVASFPPGRSVSSS